MRLRTQPEIETIVAELATWQRWTAAYYRHEVPLPELPVPQGEPSNVTMLCGFFVRSALRTVGSVEGMLHGSPAPRARVRPEHEPAKRKVSKPRKAANPIQQTAGGTGRR